jgi:hypothetical protein
MGSKQGDIGTERRKEGDKLQNRLEKRVTE